MLDLHTNEIFTLFVLITFLLGKLSLAFVNLEQKKGRFFCIVFKLFLFVKMFMSH